MSDVRRGYGADLESWCLKNFEKATIRPGGQWVDHCCPLHPDQSPSASTRLGEDRGSGKMVCRSENCPAHEDNKGLYLDKIFKDHGLPSEPPSKENWDNEPSKKKRQRYNEKDSRTWPVTARYEYQLANGENYAFAVRLSNGKEKEFRQGGWNADLKKWEWKLNLSNGVKISPIPYRLPRLSKLPPGSDVVLVEGEKDVHTAEALGFVATCTLGGSNKYAKADWSALKGMNVVIVPDNDAAGEKVTNQLLTILAPIAADLKVVRLFRKDEKAKGDLTDWVNAGGTREQFIKLCKGTKSVSPMVVKDERPEVATNGKDPRKIDLEIASIVMRNTELYSMDQKVVKVMEDHVGRKYIAEVTSDEIEAIIQDQMILVKREWRARKQEYETTPHRPSSAIIRQTLFRLSQMLPQINRVTDLPFVTNKGEIVHQGGFHEESGTYLFPFADFDIKESYSDQEVEEACKLLLEKLLGEFWFADHTSRVHAFCACLHYFLVDLIAEPTPAYMFAANRPNCGKTYLAQCIARIIERYGAKEILESSSRQNDELEKKTNSHLLNGEKIVLIDNVTSQLRESWLHGYLTAHTLSVRVLSKSKIVSMPNKHLWFITANTPKLCTDITRRTVPVNLYVSPLIEDPSDRDFRKEAKDWAESHRKELVEACLVIISSWLQAGAKKSSHKLGSYPRWARIMGGICQHVGLSGFLETQKQHLQEVDEGAKERRELLRSMVEAKGMVRYEDANFFYDALEKSNALPSRVEYSNRPEKVRIRELGRYLTDMARMNPIAGDYKLMVSKCSHRKINLYTIELTSCSVEGLKKVPGTPDQGYPQNANSPRGVYVFSPGKENSSREHFSVAGNPTESAGNLRVTSEEVTRKEKPDNQADCEDSAGNAGNFPSITSKSKKNIYIDSTKGENTDFAKKSESLPPQPRVTRNPSPESVRSIPPDEPPKADRESALRHPNIQKKLRMADRWESIGNHESAAKIRAEVEALIGAPPPPRPSPTPPEPDPPADPDEGKSDQDLLAEAFDGSEPLF